MKEV
ncbi:Protein of unknown function [Bacillus cereus]|jgi:hypothetical protein